MITFVAKKAQGKWPQRVAKAGVTELPHQIALAILSNCPRVELQLRIY